MPTRSAYFWMLAALLWGVGCTGGTTIAPPNIADSQSELDATLLRVESFDTELQSDLAGYEKGMNRFVEFGGLNLGDVPLSTFKHVLVACFNQTDSMVVETEYKNAASQLGVTCTVAAMPQLLDAIADRPTKDLVLQFVKATDTLRIARNTLQADVRRIQSLSRSTFRYVAVRRRESFRYTRELERNRELYSSDDYEQAIERTESFRSDLEKLETTVRRLTSEEQRYRQAIQDSTRRFYDNVVPLKEVN